MKINSELLKQLINESGMSYGEFGKRVGCHKSTISKIVHGRYIAATSDLIEKIVEYLQEELGYKNAGDVIIEKGKEEFEIDRVLLRKIIRQRGYTYRQLADATGFTFSGIRQLCAGKYSGTNGNLVWNLVELFEAEGVVEAGDIVISPKRKKRTEVKKMLQTNQNLLLMRPDVLEYFGLKRVPFRIAQDMKPYLNTEMVEVESLIIHAAQNKMFLNVCGEIGTGKSTVLRRAKKKLTGINNLKLLAVRSISANRLTKGYLLDKMIETWGNQKKAPARYKDKDDLVYQTIEDNCRQGWKLAIIIDQGHLLTKDSLIDLKVLWEELNTEGGGFAIIIVAQNDIMGMLSKRELHEVAQRVLSRRYDPFCSRQKDTASISGYVKHWMKISGGSEEAFSKEALEKIADTITTPLECNGLCQLALIKAKDIQEPQVSVEIVERVLQEIYR